MKYEEAINLSLFKESISKISTNKAIITEKLLARIMEIKVFNIHIAVREKMAAYCWLKFWSRTTCDYIVVDFLLSKLRFFF